MDMASRSVWRFADEATMASSSSKALKSTVWIGNIDQTATEAKVLKLVKPFGNVVKFDFIYTSKDSTCSTAERVPRGYAFVTYENYVAADEAIRGLNGIKLLSKNLKVQPASSSSTSSSSFSSVSKNLPLTLSMGGRNHKVASSTSNLSKESKIRAMEAKLKAISQEKCDEFKLVSTNKPKNNTKPYDRPAAK
jgi:RNA recognition motif-containing protein